ncbi:MAG: sugar ABC transporter permease [Kiritimatiellaeota bacterium]|nr:sugar ABC transporter permease [Kiritimatiellota bacterium]
MPTKTAKIKAAKQTATGLAFLAPNILGFLAFTLLPLVFSLVLAFTNWDIRFHNQFKPESALRFVGFANFVRLFHEPDFVKYLLNTLFLMMGIPIGIAGSLGAALLLVKDTRGGSRRVWATVICTGFLTAGLMMLVVAGKPMTAMTIVLAGVLGMFLAGGTAGGVSVYRTLFYIPNFTAGVAVFILWKKLYSDIGPINSALKSPLQSLSALVNRAGAPVFEHGFATLFVALAALAVFAMTRRLFRSWRDGELGSAALAMPLILVAAPALAAARIAPGTGPAFYAPLAVFTATLITQIVIGARSGQEYETAKWKGSGDSLMASAATLTAGFLLLGLALVARSLPALAAKTAGIEPPDWLGGYDWAKPSLMLMGLWSAIGSNNMLLYIAGLTNIPPELYEAADIDGASKFQRFWHITWPQLAPITFFIFIMSVIGGLQGGFETARTMTQGGPAGSTTTLSYFIYTQGFETGRFGSASGVAWTLFAMVLAVTALNWKFGSRYVND